MVADGAAGPNRHGIAGIGVEHATFLHVRALAKVDDFVVAPDHGSEPDADVHAEADAADHMGVRRDPEAPRRR